MVLADNREKAGKNKVVDRTDCPQSETDSCRANSIAGAVNKTAVGAAYSKAVDNCNCP